MNIVKQDGLSLIELMTTLAVVAILAALAAPSIQTMLENNRIESLARQFVGSIYTARSEAAKTGFVASICPSDPTQTACGRTYANGWLVFRDFNANRSFDTTADVDTDGDGTLDEEVILFAHDNDNPDLTVTLFSDGAANTEQSFSYLPNGLNSLRNTSNPHLRVTHTDNGDLAARITLNRGGSVSLCIAAKDDHC